MSGIFWEMLLSSLAAIRDTSSENLTVTLSVHDSLEMKKRYVLLRGWSGQCEWFIVDGKGTEEMKLPVYEW